MDAEFHDNKLLLKALGQKINHSGVTYVHFLTAKTWKMLNIG